MASLFMNFVSIGTDQKKKGLRLNKPKDHEQCMLCLQPMVRVNARANFACLRHKGHKKCLAKYMASDHY